MPNKATDPCSGGVALFLLKNEKYDTGKKELLNDIIEQCAKKKMAEMGGGNGKSTKTKKKRKMSWYNACIKVEGKEAMTTGKCKKDNLSESDIANWQKKADEFNG